MKFLLLALFFLFIPCIFSTELTTCPIVISSTDNYTLNSQLNSSSYCIQFTTGSEGSNLDCNGNIINYNGTSSSFEDTGVYIRANNISVRNCIVNNFNENFFISPLVGGDDNILLYNNSEKNATSQGIRINTNVENISIINFEGDSDIYLRGNNNNNFFRNIVLEGLDSEFRIGALDGASNNVFDNLTFINSGDMPFYTTSSYVISNNFFTDITFINYSSNSEAMSVYGEGNYIRDVIFMNSTMTDGFFGSFLSIDGNNNNIQEIIFINSTSASDEIEILGDNNNLSDTNNVSLLMYGNFNTLKNNTFDNLFLQFGLNNSINDNSVNILAFGLSSINNSISNSTISSSIFNSNWSTQPQLFDNNIYNDSLINSIGCVDNNINITCDSSFTLLSTVSLNQGTPTSTSSLFPVSGSIISLMLLLSSLFLFFT